MYELKKRVRNAAPGLARAVSAVWRSPPVDYMFHAQRRWRMRRALARRDGVFGFDISGMMGLGATLSNMVILLNFCDEQGLQPYVRFGNPHYRSKATRDWFPQFFSLRAVPGSQPPTSFVPIGSEHDYRLPQVDLAPSLQRAGAVFRRYVTFDEALLQEADAFAAAHGLDHTSIGVHFRGTDKNYEAPPAPWGTALETLRLLAAASPRARIFLATDEPDVISAARQTELAPRLAIYDCREIFTGGRAAYIADGDRRRKAHEALITLLLLAKCGVCIRTASHLSAWASILNPDQKVVMLNRPFSEFMYFPDAMIWEQRWAPDELAARLREEGRREQA